MQIRVGLIIHERLCVIHLYAGRIKRNMFSRNWRRKRQPISVFLPGKFHRQGSMAGYSPWGRRVGHNLATKQQTKNKTRNLTLY